MRLTTTMTGRLALVLACSHLVGHSIRRITAEEEGEHDPSSSEEECQLYLAPSTIPGAGMGIFAGVDFDENDLITYGDIAIPILKIPFHLDKPGYGDGYFLLWEEYSWDSQTFTGINEDFEGSVADVAEDIQVASMGIGAMPNCKLGLTNIKSNTRSTLHDTSTLDRKSPGNGAFTPYHSRIGVAAMPIGAGWELFENYGTSYFDTRHDIYGAVPRHAGDYQYAENITQSLAQFQQQHAEIKSKPFIRDLYRLIKDFPWDSPVLNALPNLRLSEDDYDDFQRQHFEYLLKKGARIYARSQTIRSTEWLKEHGQCMDLIRPDDSTIQHAGRGAFATRFIPKDGKIAPIPLIHIPDRAMLTMYKEEEIFHAANESKNDEHWGGWEDEGEDWTEIRRNVNAPIHKQLLLNYCFGHPNSSMLLSPYGSITSLVNHGSKSEANARIVWAKDWMRNPEWLKLSPSALVEQRHSGLGFDLIALRDIQPDEEILLDYGDEFEEAWKNHIEQWDGQDPRFTGTSFPYVPAEELNRNIEQVLTEALENKIDYTSDGHGVRLWCYERGGISDEETPLGEGEIDVSGNIHVNLAGHNDAPDEGRPQQTDSMLQECRPVQKSPAKENGEAPFFEVEILDWIETEGQPDLKMVVKGVQFLVPSMFLFTNLPHTKAMQEVWSFRQEMKIPDDMMPKAWLNNGIIDTTNSTII